MWLLTVSQQLIDIRNLFLGEHPVPYNITCTNLEGSLYWPYDDHGLGFDDGKISSFIHSFINKDKFIHSFIH